MTLKKEEPRKEEPKVEVKKPQPQGNEFLIDTSKDPKIIVEKR